jgi:hypothetical protein
MGRILQIMAAILILAFRLDALSWPSVDAVLTRNFGSNDRGLPVMGMVFTGGNEVLASEKGEVIFSRSSNSSGNYTLGPASRLPSPFGAWTAVDHGDGLISIYSRYENENSNLREVERSQPVAMSGVSGWSQQNGFYFIIFDRRERRWANPAMIITPVQETRPPQILSVVLRNAQGEAVQTRNINQGRYTVVVNAVSPAPLRPNILLAPQRIVSSVNGSEAASFNFEAFSARDGVLMVYRNGLVPAKQIYSSSPAFEAAEIFLSRGQANLEIIVQDIAGRNASFINRLIVN